MTSILRYPFESDGGGRLARLCDPPLIVMQLLALVRDLAGGEFPGLPKLSNPCDEVEAEADEIVHELGRRTHKLLSSLRGLELAVAARAVKNGSLLGWIDISDGPGAWRLKVPVIRGESNVLLQLDMAERSYCDA